VTLRRSLGAAFAALVLLAGCADAPTAPEAGSSRVLSGAIDGSLLRFASLPDLSGTRHAEKRIIAAQGGFVELNGFRVDIPAGALPADTVVTIDLPSDPALAKRLVAEFGPHGIQFNTPVTLRFPLTGVVLNGGAIEVARWENGAWTSLGGSVNALGTTLSGTTPHFSLYGGKYVMAGG
jgi:hypothetical protein